MIPVANVAKPICAGMLLLILLAAGCDQNVGPPGMTPSPERTVRAEKAAPPPGDQPAASPTGSDSAAGISWTRPERWTAEAQRPMRAATYSIPAANGDAEPGECGVFYFGAAQGGDIDANLKRWFGQFEQPAGKSSEQAAKTERKKINSLNVTTVDLAGTYLASAAPMSPVKEKKPGYRLLGAIVEAPQGNVFFKFTGPAKTVQASEREFTKMLDSLRK